jgi:hypothetical protein
MVEQPEVLPEPEAAWWESIRALDVSRISGPVAEAIASHPRIEAVFGLECGCFYALMANAPDVGLRHVELAPGGLAIPIGGFDRPNTFPRLTRFSLAGDLGPLRVPWLLSSFVGKRLTHLAFGLDRKDLAETLSVLKDFGENVQHVALLRPEGSRTVRVNLFTQTRRPAAYVPWCRLIRDGAEFVATEVEPAAVATAQVFEVPPEASDKPPAYVPRAAFSSARVRPVFETWPAPTTPPGASALEEEAFWEIIERAQVVAHGRAGEECAAAVVSELVLRAPEQILAFRDRLDVLVATAHTLELRVAQYIATGFWSDDGFLYFVHWLVAQGREVYMRVVGAPDTLADIVPAAIRTPREASALTFETLMYSASRAYEQRTGEPLPAGVVVSSDPARGRNTAPPPLDPTELQRRYPKIWGRFRPPPSPPTR